MAPRVIVAFPNQPLVSEPVDHRPAHKGTPLIIPNLLLTDLAMPFIHIYDIHFVLIGQYLSYSAAIQALSPVLTLGLTGKRAEVKSRQLQRACNWHITAKTEFGSVYVARHPSLVNRSKGT